MTSSSKNNERKSTALVEEVGTSQNIALYTADIVCR